MGGGETAGSTTGSSGTTGGYQGQTFLGGLPIIGNLLNGASKNPGAGSSSVPSLTQPDLGSLLGHRGASPFGNMESVDLTKLFGGGF